MSNIDRLDTKDTRHRKFAILFISKTLNVYSLFEFNLSYKRYSNITRQHPSLSSSSYNRTILLKTENSKMFVFKYGTFNQILEGILSPIHYANFIRRQNELVNWLNVIRSISQNSSSGIRIQVLLSHYVSNTGRENVCFIKTGESQ